MSAAPAEGPAAVIHERPVSGSQFNLRCGLQPCSGPCTTPELDLKAVLLDLGWPFCLCH